MLILKLVIKLLFINIRWPLMCYLKGYLLSGHDTRLMIIIAINGNLIAFNGHLITINGNSSQGFEDLPRNPVASARHVRVVHFIGW